MLPRCFLTIGPVLLLLGSVAPALCSRAHLALYIARMDAPLVDAHQIGCSTICTCVAEFRTSRVTDEVSVPNDPSWGIGPIDRCFDLVEHEPGAEVSMYACGHGRLCSLFGSVECLNNIGKINLPASYSQDRPTFRMRSVDDIIVGGEGTATISMHWSCPRDQPYLVAGGPNAGNCRRSCSCGPGGIGGLCSTSSPGEVCLDTMVLPIKVQNCRRTDAPTWAPTRPPSANPTRHSCTDGSHDCDRTDYGICEQIENTARYRCSCASTHRCSDSNCTTPGHTCVWITESPTISTTAPTIPIPTVSPTRSPSNSPTSAPTNPPMSAPTTPPTSAPTTPPTTLHPTFDPTGRPTLDCSSMKNLYRTGCEDVVGSADDADGCIVGATFWDRRAHRCAPCKTSCPTGYQIACSCNSTHDSLCMIVGDDLGTSQISCGADDDHSGGSAKGSSLDNGGSSWAVTVGAIVSAVVVVGGLLVYFRIRRLYHKGHHATEPPVHEFGNGMSWLTAPTKLVQNPSHTPKNRTMRDLDFFGYVSGNQVTADPREYEIPVQHKRNGPEYAAQSTGSQSSHSEPLYATILESSEGNNGNTHAIPMAAGLDEETIA